MKMFFVKISVSVITFLLGVLISLPYRSISTFLTPTQTAFAFPSPKLEKNGLKEKIRIEIQGYRQSESILYINYWLINDSKESIYYEGFVNSLCPVVEKYTDEETYKTSGCVCFSGASMQQLKGGQSKLFKTSIYHSNSAAIKFGSPIVNAIKFSLPITIGKSGKEKLIESEKIELPKYD